MESKTSDEPRVDDRDADELTVQNVQVVDYLAKEKEGIQSPITIMRTDDEPPDGGTKAWLIVLGSLTMNFSTFGFINAWGTFQAYYEQTLLPGTSPSAIAWIGSIQYSLVFLPGLVSGRLFDLGYFRIPLLVASLIHLAATFLIAECKEYWQFLLCQGIALGLASGAMFGPTQGIIAHWFKKRRQTALGITAVGSSIGGTVFPIVFRNLVGKIGFPWTIRVIGFILFFTIGIANMCLRRRLPPVNISGGLFNWKAFKSAPFTIYVFTCFVAFLGLYTVLTYIDISAVSVGISPDFAPYLVSIANASSALGRLLGGFLADRVGGINIMVPFTMVAGIMTYVWPFAHSQSSYIIVAIIYGLTSGVYVSLLIAPILALGETGDVGRRVGMTMTIQAFGALAGPPISGAINGATHGFTAVGIYAGTMIMFSVALMLTVRYLVLRRLWGKF
ncbi:hypothetical protein JAAARDRAFT_32317 [Jaapia argillacea MUCL 33604]|uniref:Major facilitator superfamily (MFS) profile domain-containing protein n=1 Tax=Jaapia argillacea MUCL 33604 TaxID=933084 RepID=A0A067Q583_9AGAM|nr:hypothetical protein JAAARDRAFT_32317 [Jaapia argillacea MUCL 33604]